MPIAATAAVDEQLKGDHGWDRFMYASPAGCPENRGVTIHWLSEGDDKQYFISMADHVSDRQVLIFMLPSDGRPSATERFV
jgi:hypothetical protein